MALNTTTLINPEKDGKITVQNHVVEYYLKRGYLPYKKNSIKKKYLQKIDSNFLRKLKILITLIFNSKFILKDPKKSDIVIYDCQSTEVIEKVLPNDNYIIVSTRIKRIKTLYLSRRIIFFIILNFFKRTLKQNYLAALIEIISPKFVITQIDNSVDFYLTARIFKNRIKFIAVQNANRGDTVWSPIEKTKKIFIPEFLCFGGYDEHLYRKKKCNVGKFEIIGSLRTSICKEYVKSEKININPQRYDICLLGEPHPTVGPEADYPHVKNFTEAIGKVAEYTHRLCDKKKLNLIFIGKRVQNEEASELEILFYQKYLKDYNFKIFQPSSRHDRTYEFSSYRNIMQSKLVIGHISTMLREAFAFDKKVLQCNFTEHPDVIFPCNGLCVLNNVSYDLFEQRVLEILSMKEAEYFNRLSVQRDFIMESSINTADFVRRKLKNYLT